MQASNVANENRSMFSFTATLTPAATATAVAAEQAFTVTNGTNASTLPVGIVLKQTDHVTVTGPGSGNAIGIAGARINSSAQVVINFINPTAGSLTHAAGTFIVKISRMG